MASQLQFFGGVLASLGGVMSFMAARAPPSSLPAPPPPQPRALQRVVLVVNKGVQVNIFLICIVATIITSAAVTWFCTSSSIQRKEVASGLAECAVLLNRRISMGFKQRMTAPSRVPLKHAGGQKTIWPRTKATAKATFAAVTSVIKVIQSIPERAFVACYGLFCITVAYIKAKISGNIFARAPETTTETADEKDPDALEYALDALTDMVHRSGGAAIAPWERGLSNNRARREMLWMKEIDEAKAAGDLDGAWELLRELEARD